MINTQNKFNKVNNMEFDNAEQQNNVIFKSCDDFGGVALKKLTTPKGIAVLYINEDGKVKKKIYKNTGTDQVLNQINSDFSFALPSKVGETEINVGCLRKVINTTIAERDTLDEIIRRYNIYTSYKDSIKHRTRTLIKQETVEQ